MNKQTRRVLDDLADRIWELRRNNLEGKNEGFFNSVGQGREDMAYDKVLEILRKLRRPNITGEHDDN